MYENIIDEKITNDEEAKLALGYSKNSKSFSKFRERYTKKIIDYILLSDAHIKSNDFVNEEYYRLLKLFAAGKVVHYHQQRINSIKIYSYVFNQAKNLDFFDILLLSGLELRQYFAYVQPNQKKV